MSDLVKELRNTLLLIPMKGGGELVTSLGVFAADRIEELEHMFKDITKFYENEIEQLEADMKSQIDTAYKNGYRDADMGFDSRYTLEEDAADAAIRVFKKHYPSPPEDET